MIRYLPILLFIVIGAMTLSYVVSAMNTSKEHIPLIPREIFFAETTDDMDVQISPNGKQISFLKPYQGVPNIWVQNVHSQEALPVTHSQDTIVNHFWAYNNEQILFFRDFKGDENFHLYAVDLKTFNIIDLTPFDNIQARLIRDNEHHPDEIVLGINNRDPAYHDLWLINTRTGQRKLLYENTDAFGDLFVDHDYQLRIARKSDGTGGYTIWRRDPADKAWKPLLHFDRENSLGSRVLDFSADNTRLYYLDSTDSNTTALYSIRIDAEHREKIAATEQSDIESVLFDPIAKQPRAAISQFLRRQYLIIDPSIQADMRYLEQLSTGDLLLLDSSLDDRIWIVGYLHDNKPLRYYLYDRSKGVATFLFSSNPKLERLPLTTMQPVIIPSRDGLKLISYLSMPRQGPQKKIPMVLWVHGGPWSRDVWGYNVIHQWLTNRGYAVLSVNFRGSTGFGKQFVNAANREWSKKMQEDLIDAVNWSIAQGIADPKKICIAGASYGGYATLVGLTSTPELFACGIDIVGLSDLQTLLESYPPYMKDELDEMAYRIGAGDDKEFLKSISPLYRIDRISKPLLIVHGQNDVRVSEQASASVVEAMKKKKKPVIYVLFPDEGHVFTNGQNDLAVYAIIEAFLAQELGGRSQEIGDAVKNSSALILEGQERLLHEE